MTRDFTHSVSSSDERGEKRTAQLLLYSTTQWWGVKEKMGYRKHSPFLQLLCHCLQQWEKEESGHRAAAGRQHLATIMYKKKIKILQKMLNVYVF